MGSMNLLRRAIGLFDLLFNCLGIAILVLLPVPLQRCPFLTCNFLWNDDFLIFNKLTEKFLLIIRGTKHLARKHQLLEKGNGYGISTVDFYLHFAEPVLWAIQQERTL
ncbi:MAG: hypothetical protein ACFFFH_16375 [Candidatus Thorarchaeota archaeon]